MKLSEKRTTPIAGTNYYAGAELKFDAVDGMIVGEALVDAEWRASWRDIRYQLTPPPNETFDNITVLTQDNFIELGVFVNDVCCSRTDLQWEGGRFTYVLPFSTPIGTTTAQIDIRFRIFFSNKFVTQTAGVVTDSAIAPFWIHDSSIWARNQYR
jgi:thiazole synthase ThiGH ThiG subunit